MRRLIPVILLFALPVGWIAAECILMQRAVRPAHVTSLDGWLAWQPEADHFVVHRSGKHLLALGPHAGLVPSGPSVYVFDSTGRLVDSTLDVGDDPDFDKRWDAQTPLQTIDRAEAEDWLGHASEGIEERDTPQAP